MSAGPLRLWARSADHPSLVRIMIRELDGDLWYHNYNFDLVTDQWNSADIGPYASNWTFASWGQQGGDTVLDLSQIKTFTIQVRDNDSVSGGVISFDDLEIISPAPPYVFVSPSGGFSTNQAFTATLAVEKNMGYWSTNEVQWHQFDTNGTNIFISQTTTLWYFGDDGAGNVSTTNSNTHIFDTAAPLVSIISGPSGDVTTNTAFTIVLNTGESYGYWSTNGITYSQFISQTNIDITVNTPGLWYYGEDMLGNNSGTNSHVYTFTADPPSPDVCTTFRIRPTYIDESVSFGQIEGIPENNETVTVYNLNGDAVIEFSVSIWETAWDGKRYGRIQDWPLDDSNGQPLSRGTYFIKGEKKVIYFLIAE
ncbi:MAG: hypothetical protein GF372_03590 [Candidatus Marinimicrobia bacterium]|nr:hypothetical protein [Candidatus Neomarinimicrobiota bacterium]